MISKLKERGALHAAYMHEMGDSRQWSPQDIYRHLVEEEVLIFPDFPALLRAVLIEHHRAFRSQLAYRGMVDPDMWAMHGALEDAAVEAYL